MRLVHDRRPDIHTSNELLVQYAVPGRNEPGQVVPDNTVVVHAGPLKVNTNYALSLQPARPFRVMHYPFEGDKRKDSKQNLRQYEHELKVPYYSVCDLTAGDFTLFKLSEGGYVPVDRNDRGRAAVHELDIELGLQGGLVRYWFRGELLLRPAELLRLIEQTRQQTEEIKRLADEEKRRADEQDRVVAELRAELARRAAPRVTAGGRSRVVAVIEHT